MTISRTLLLLVTLLIVASLPSRSLLAAEAYLIRHARVFDGSKVSDDTDVIVRDGFNGAVVAEDTDVIVRDGVVQQVGKNLSAADATVIDATSQTLLPGLIDSHAHILAPSVLRQAAAFGVTTELDMFMAVTVMQQLRAGDAPPSQNFARADFRSAGTLATAPGGHGTQYGVTIETLTAPDQAERFVDARIAEGSDYIKIIYDDGSSVGMKFTKLSRETLASVIAAAHAKGKLAVVHVSDQASAREAIEAGADGLAHVFVDEPADDALIKLAKDRKIFIIPTLSVMENFGRPDDAESPLARDPHLAPMMTLEDAAALRVRFPRRANVKARVETAVENVRALHTAGIKILAGTDVPNPGTLHGVSLHRELELLVEAGLTPLEALRAATSAPADAFKLSDRGRIAPGKRADLVLVDGDPTRDIKATRAISHIFIAGQKFDRDAYRTMIERRNQALASLAAPGKLLISDFEDGPAVNSTFGAGWSISTDQIQRGKSTCEFKIVEDGADNTNHSLKIQGSINPPLPWAWAGAMFSPGASVMGPADLSGKKKISFWAKGDGKDARLMIFSRSGGFAPAFVTFKPGEKWERHAFELREFRDETGKDLTAVLFSGGVEHGAFEYQIDQLSFQ